MTSFDYLLPNLVKKRDEKLAKRGITSVEDQINAELEHNKTLQQNNEQKLVIVFSSESFI